MDRYKVTPAEREVLILWAKGYPAWEIAKLRSVSRRTVEHQIEALNRTFGVHNREALIAKARKAGVMSGGMPEQPYGPGAFCGTCGHFAARHNPDGCSGVNGPCSCRCMQWEGYRWPRPWLPAPEGLRPS